MFFNSLTFAIFLPIVVFLFWVLPRRWRIGLLLVSSYVFYGWWDYRFLALIAVSTVTDFLVGLRIFNASSAAVRKRWLMASLTVNLGILGFFKYWGFFVESAAQFLSKIGADPGVATLSVILPVGISFYTFQTLSYSIDVYRGEIEPETNLATFGLFVAFFPQLVAGPIERAKRLLPQLKSLPDRIEQIEWSQAIALLLRGLFRKVVIADGVAPLVNEVFSKPEVYGTLTVAAGVVGFSLQIYGDFAGYTDIARGVAKLFGVNLMVNFRAPYRARSFTDFWRRWHISLSTWLRDYLYVPLGGNRRGHVRMYVNLMITMLLGGLWHGAGYGFIVWGGLHGAYLVVERIVKTRRGLSASPALPAVVVFAIVSLTWIPFRSPHFSAMTGMLSALGTFSGATIPSIFWIVGLLGIMTMVIDEYDMRGEVNPVAFARPAIRGFTYGIMAVLTILFASQTPIPFIYFQF